MSRGAPPQQGGGPPRKGPPHDRPARARFWHPRGGPNAPRFGCPRGASNARARLRRPVLYPTELRGHCPHSSASRAAPENSTLPSPVPFRPLTASERPLTVRNVKDDAGSIWSRLVPGPQRFVPHRVVRAAQAFVRVEASSGIVLLAAALAALAWANSPWDGAYVDLWRTRIVVDASIFTIDADLRHWLNDGLMTLFFFLMGLEIKRELAHGELSDPRRGLLPAIAALGGMAAPAAIYAAFNAGGAGADGWGIPMATDIAFALGVLSLLGRRVPFSVKVFLLA